MKDSTRIGLDPRLRETTSRKFGIGALSLIGFASCLLLAAPLRAQAPAGPEGAASAGAERAGAAGAPTAAATLTKGDLKRVIDRGCNWLIDQQRPDGGYGSYVSDAGITALVVNALARSPRGYEEEDGPFISAAVDYLLSHRNEDGSIYEKGRGLWNYKTSISLVALAELDKGRNAKRYGEVVAAARDYIAALQCSEVSQPVPYDRQKNRNAFGGIGYGSDRRPDMSNTQFALEALRASGMAEDSDVFQRAQLFLTRCQNTEKNDILDGKERKSTGDGGFYYQPGESKAGMVKDANGVESLRSYGSMTYAGVKSYIYAGLSKEDPRLKAAWSWIRHNFTVDENPGMATPKDPKRGQMGLFYYYVVMARTFEVLDMKTFEDANGKTVDWAQELGRKMVALQHPDGYWKNPVSRWMEADPAVVTAYSVWALSIVYDQLP